MCVVSMLSWPSHKAITAMSIPACSRCIAQVCRLCLSRHRRHYLPFRTMSGSGEPLPFGPEIPDGVAKSLSESPDIVSCLLQAVQEGEESIAGFVTPRCSIGRGCLGKCFLLHGKCRFEINLCGFNMFVTEPQCDHRTIDACLQKIHGHGVPQAVHGDTFVFQRRAQVGSSHPMLV